MRRTCILSLTLVIFLITSAICYADDEYGAPSAPSVYVGDGKVIINAPGMPQQPASPVVKERRVMQCAPGTVWSPRNKRCISEDGEASPPTPPSTQKAFIPIQEGQNWNGYYVCAQGATNLVLKITHVSWVRPSDYYDIEAIFDFDFANGRCTGQFNVKGQYNKSSRSLELHPAGWIVNPCNYNQVGLRGIISRDGATYVGTIPQCREFKLRL